MTDLIEAPCFRKEEHGPHYWGWMRTPYTKHCPGIVKDQPPHTVKTDVLAAIERADLVIGGFVQHDWSSSMSVHEWYREELRKLRDAVAPKESTHD